MDDKTKSFTHVLILQYYSLLLLTFKSSTFDQNIYLPTMSPIPIAPSVKSYPKSTDTKWARMRYCLSILLTFNFAFLISACGLDIEDPTPPSPPLWVQKSLPEEWPERGIDAHESGGIYLEWEPNPEDNIVAHMIYRAEYFDANDSLGNYELLSVSEVDQGLKLEYVDESVKTKTQYYFKLKSEDSAGNVSQFSDAISYALLSTIQFESMEPNGQFTPLPQDRNLSWTHSYLNEMENYLITLISSDDKLIERLVLQPQNYFDGKEFWQIPSTIPLDSGSSYMWRVDTGANYNAFGESAGSESVWATFIYID